MSQASPKEVPCPDCGEMVRVNSLRCWNCGGFMSPEVEQKYIAMQAMSRPAIFSEVPSGEIKTAEEDRTEGDFQLKSPVARTMSGPDAEMPSMDTRVQNARSAAAQAATEEADEDDLDAPIQIKSEPAPAAAAAEPAATEPAKPRRPQPESDIAHSVATAGDALLDIAIQEEREVKKKQKGRKIVGGMKTPGGGLIIFCPYGCRVEVKESHRGMTGRCPRCAAPFIVPVDPPQFKQAKTEDAAAPGAAAPSAGAAGQFQNWILDLHLHIVDPEKLKLKADSLLKEFTEVDVGVSSAATLVASLAKKAGGMFAKGGEKKDAVRAAMLTHLAEGKPLDELPVGDKYVFDAMDMPQLKIVQPAANRATSIFHGIPVFGANRIALQLPLTEKTVHPTYLSMGITEYWKLAKALEAAYGISGLDAGLGLPPEPRTHDYKCHFTDTPIKALLDVELFKADPSVKLEVAGYQCGACKIAVSEAGRKKENLGGKTPKGIAKAKCPKCGSKMGEHLLYSLKEDVAEPSLA
ncbi:hypothetical protein [Planctomicrobium piriforme]|uniref:Uncharacterized protein n=1 Tax=Planctomicrobium piriforme TaxID=1576369 RepID=A0A1I3F5Q6_9PLAN|nr:hypothetical protein [Planctomicrobium piriforme]SFI06522.1 hypothetical protein SAMN05421753_10594 [Planctomicrobium piriforme]